jgi:hypothetical protein
VTEQSPDTERPTWRESSAQEPLPRRGPPAADDSAPGSGGGSLFEKPQRVTPPADDLSEPSVPQRGPAPLPQRGADRLPQRGAQPLPQRGAQPLPQRSPEPLPQRGADPLPQRGAQPLPQRGAEPLPQRRTEPLPQRGAEPLPQRGAEPLPQRGAEPLPQRGGDLPQRGGNGTLPRRTGRTRPAGRHRSPHRLSVASDAPALVIAVPGAASDDAIRVAEEIASTAETSCPGIEIRLGFLEGAEHLLDDNLVFDGGPAREHPLDGVLVPLLAGPHPLSDASLIRAADGASGQVMLGAHLGPHPLIAEALHARLAEAGLARGARSRGLSIASSTYGVLVLADRGEDAVKTAGVAAVLLASRLAMPAAPASIDDPAGIDAALARLREAGAQRPVIAPCVIGPETSVADLEAVSAAIGAPYASPLGSHAAVGQLVAIRYGAALTRLSRVG